MSKKFTLRDIVFDDVVKSEEDGYNDWSQVCQSCVDKHQLAADSEDMSLDEAGSGICGIAGCERTANFYIDFADGTLREVQDDDEQQGGEHMKTYLAKFTIIEGGHHYGEQFVVSATTYDEATTIAKSQEHEPTIPDEQEELTSWDYGDGTTASRLDGVLELTAEEVIILRRLGVAFNFN